VFELPRGWKRKRGETLVDHFARWCELALVHGRDQFAGQSFVLEAWERAFLTDALEEEAGMPVWSSVALIVARKNGKTSLLAAWSLYRLIFGVGQPEILLAAASDRQAGRLFEAVVGYIRRNPLLVKLVHLREYIGEVSRVDGGGKILRMASDPSTLFGYDPSDVVIDELHAWTKPSLRQAWTALTTGGGGRKTTRVFSISTAGDAQARADSILGRLLDGNEQHGELEQRPGLTISRNPGARTLVWSYSAPTLDPRNVAAMKLANPASWITVDYLRRQAENPELSDADVLQLHGCVWAVGESSWLDPAAWAARKAVRGLEEDETIVLGFDGSYRRDATALVACTLDGHLVPLAIWERPERAPGRLEDPPGGGRRGPRRGDGALPSGRACRGSARLARRDRRVARHLRRDRARVLDESAAADGCGVRRVPRRRTRGRPHSQRRRRACPARRELSDEGDPVGDGCGEVGRGAEDRRGGGCGDRVRPCRLARTQPAFRRLGASMSSSVPRLRGVAVAEDVVLIGGAAAWFLAKVLTDGVPGGLEGFMDRLGVRGSDARDVLIGACLALGEVGDRWQQARAASPPGNEEGQSAGQRLASERWLSTRTAADLLGVTPRRVRQLAEGGELSSRLRHGRRELPWQEVCALRELRNQQRAAA
jgi:hypothetical protein